MLPFRAFMLLKRNSHFNWHMHNFDIENIIQTFQIIIPSEKSD